MDGDYFPQYEPGIYLARNCRIDEAISKQCQRLEDFYSMKLRKSIKVYFVADEIVFHREICNADKALAIAADNFHWHMIYIVRPQTLDEGATIKTITGAEIGFWNLLNHEIAHCYFNEATKCHIPSWLNEGLSEYFSKPEPKTFGQEEVLEVLAGFSSIEIRQYRIAHHIVSRLICLYGRERLVLLLRQIGNDIQKIPRGQKYLESDFASAFSQIYGFDFDRGAIATDICR